MILWPCLPATSPLPWQLFLLCGCDWCPLGSLNNLEVSTTLNNSTGGVLKSGGQVCAVVLSGRCMATKPMCFCDPCLEKDITLTISKQNTANRHRLALPNLCEACETLRKYVHSTMPEIIIQCRAQMTMGWLQWLISSLGSVSWDLSATHCACGCYLLWFWAA